MRIYFMGICGTAMGNAALLLREMGYEVCGSDTGTYPPMSEYLAGAGIEIFEGFDSTRLASLSLDQVVVGNAMSRGNPEVEWLLNQSDVPFISLPQVFHETILKNRLPIVISGTHGKTTTSSIAAYLLESNGLQPGWLIGGLPCDLPGGSALGKGRPFVIEGDEYDSAFFDKRSKFIHYRPHIAVINNLEFDHADIFRDLKDIQRSFNHLLRIIPGNGVAIVNGDDPNINDLLPIDWTQVVKVGTGEDNDLIITSFSEGPGGSGFELVWEGKFWTKVSWKMHGLFNARNAAMASLAASFATDIKSPLGFSLSALSRFGGVKRRQDVIYSNDHWIILEDFAHHPTAIAATIDTLRSAYPDKLMTVCFEPRSNTARTNLCQSEFTESFKGADRVHLGVVHRADKIDENKRLDIFAMAAQLYSAGLDAIAHENNTDLKDQLVEAIKEEAGGMIVFFTNGSFDGLPAKIVEYLKQNSPS